VPLNLTSNLLHINLIFLLFIGGGAAGCSTLYQLTKRGVNAILLERGQLTCGTTWHTGRVKLEIFKLIIGECHCFIDMDIGLGWIN
jgi:ribulose 1,5-bisphosphate synthetase/thiazole synthase